MMRVPPTTPAVHARRCTPPRHGRLVATALAIALAAGVRPTAAGAALVTVTTTYEYNADGAPAAVRTQVGDAPSTTSYLTWDNFTPDAGAPAGGTVRAANGNLVGVGAQPGLDGQFGYDARNRLTACRRPERPATSYAYHAASLMQSSTLESGDALQFYYDNSAAPQMINTSQPSSGTSASFLGPVRYLSDGSEQILFTPRKDVAGLYDATQRTLAPYRYDPYGASTDPATPARQHVSTSALGPSPYDLSANPFQYAGEYRDPTCDAYYLRARWYLPEQQTFLSRDPADGMHRYGYTAGDPVGRADPSGFRHTGSFAGGVGRLMHRLSPGAWAYVTPLLPVYGQVLGGVQTVGLMASFWHHPTTEDYVAFGFLAGSMAAEAGLHVSAFDRLLGSSGAFGLRLVADAEIGATQTVAQSYRHGRIDVPALLQGIEGATGGIFWERMVGGVGYRPYALDLDDVDEMVMNFRIANRGSHDALVFRVHTDLTEENSTVGPLRRGLSRLVDGPILDWASIGAYHESLVAVGPGTWVNSEVTPTMSGELHAWRTDEHFMFDNQGFDQSFLRSRGVIGDDGSVTDQLSGNARFRFAGRVGRHAFVELPDANPLHYPEWERDPRQQSGNSPYDWRTNNTHHHVAAVLGQLGL